MGRERKQVNSSTDNLGMGGKYSRCCVHGYFTAWECEGRKGGKQCVCKCASPTDSFAHLIDRTVKSGTIICCFQKRFSLSAAM